MSGPEKSGSPRDKVDDFIDHIEEYGRELGLLPPDPLASRVRSYLANGPDDWDDVEEVDLAKMNLDVASYCCRLQEVIGLQKAKIERCRLQVARLVEPTIGGSSRFKDEDKRTEAIFADDLALSYHQIMRNCEAFVARWEWYGQRLDKFGDRLRDKAMTRAR